MRLLAAPCVVATTHRRLTHTTSDIKHLAWPFFAWGAVIVVIYLVSYLQFASVEESLVNLKMFERSTGQAARTMYYMNELALEAVRRRARDGCECESYTLWINSRN